MLIVPQLFCYGNSRLTDIESMAYSLAFIRNLCRNAILGVLGKWKEMKETISDAEQF